MKPEEIGQPHDRLVKQVFGRKESAARFLQEYLPPNLAASLAWSQLEVRSGSFVDAKLRHQESDLLFRVPFRGLKGRTAKHSDLGQDLFLYCLCEHQKNTDRWMMLRLLAYMVQIWQEFLR